MTPAEKNSAGFIMRGGKMNKHTTMQHINEAALLLKASEVCGEQGKKLEALNQRLENREFIISVFGQFKRGKSTLINAVLGEDVLPVGIVPVTSVVTQIKCGEKSALLSDAEGTREIPFEELYQYINEQHNPNNIKRVDSVLIRYPSELLSTGITIVDTPGVGSMHKHNSDAAYSFVKSSDAVIFMLSVDSPINEIESGFLSQIKEYASKIYFAVNKVDVVSTDELEEYINYCQKIIGGIVNSDQIKIYPVYARNALDSGLKRLLSDILSDIATEGEAILVDSVRLKARDIIHEGIAQIQLYLNALEMPLNKLEETAKAFEQRLDMLESISKDTVYLIEQRTDELLDSIRLAFEEEHSIMTREVCGKIKSVFENAASLKPKMLEAELSHVLEAELTLRLSRLNERGISMLKSGYEHATSVFGESLGKIHAYLSTTIKELFHVDYFFDEDTYTLSEASDFYIDVNRVNASFFFDVSGLVRLLPKASANRKILERVLESVDKDVLRNITNMISDYGYKIRESKRLFNSQFVSKANELKLGFKSFIEKTLSERRISGEMYEGRITRLSHQERMLKQCVAELT